jgi:outer membrane protein assembly factor BamD
MIAARFKVSGKSFVSPPLIANRRMPVLAALICALFLSACGAWRSTQEEIETAKVERVYEISRTSLENGNYDRAVRNYKRLSARFPFGDLTERAQLDMAFAQSKLGDSDEALATANRFIKTYPTNKHADYAYYLRALVNMERQNTLVDRILPQDKGAHDQSTNKQAFLDFADFLKRYPDSSYAPEARARMVVLRGLLADYELRVAKYYLRRAAYVGAINRAKVVVENYQQSEQSYDALAVMIASYKGLSQDQLATETEAVLKLNKPDHAYFTGAEKSGRWWLFGN